MAAATMYVTVAGAGGKDGTDWDNAMGYAEWQTDLEGASEAGDIYYVAGGTYNLTSSLDYNGRHGTSLAPISIIGVNSGTTNEPPVYSDWAMGDNRPLLAAGANRGLYTGNFSKVFNFRATSTSDYGILANYSCVLFNIKSTGAATGSALFARQYTRVVSCEGSSTAGSGLNCTLSDIMVLFCYLHDCAAGGILGNATIDILFCVIDTCVVGIDMVSTRLQVHMLNNTIYNCGTGIAGYSSTNCSFINNIINDCTVGANWDTAELSNLWLNNNLEGNGTKLINVPTTLPHSDWLETTANPAFTDDSGGNFSLASGSACLDAGLAMILGVG